jgi:hypothetical protein
MRLDMVHLLGEQVLDSHGPPQRPDDLFEFLSGVAGWTTARSLGYVTANSKGGFGGYSSLTLRARRRQ